MSLTKVSFSMINGAVVNVLDYGAIADGNGTGSGTDNSAAIQAAITAVVDSGIKGTVYIPSGIYRCDTGLTIDLSLCSIQGEGSTLDFTNLVPETGGAYAAGTAANWIGPVKGAALTVICGGDGYAGGAFYEYTNRIANLRIKGKLGLSEGGVPPAPPNDLVGVYFYGPVGQTSINAKFESVVISQFYTGVVFGQNEFGTTFDNCAFPFNATCIYMPQANNAGERNVFRGCQIQNSVNGAVLQNSNADTYFENTSFDGLSGIYCLFDYGQISFNGCHFEGDTSSANMFWNNSGDLASYATITLNACTVIAKTGRPNGLFMFDGPTICSIHGGLFNDTTGSTTALFTGTGVSSNAIVTGGYWTSNGELFGFTGTHQTSAVGVLGLGYDGVIATDGIFTNNNKTLSVTDVATSFGIPVNACGLLLIRDATSGGTALLNCQPAGIVSIQDSTTGLTFSYSGGGLLQAVVASGANPRLLKWAFIRVQ